MDKKFLKHLKEDSELYEVLKNEPHFPATDLLKELEPLLNDYFEAQFEFNGREIVAVFLNGQKIRISAEEIK